MNYFQSNMKYLKLFRPDLVKIILAKPPDKIETAVAKSGAPTLKLKDKNVFLLSAYDPIREGEQWAARNQVSERNVALIMGFGLAYHLRPLLKEGKSPGKVIIMDPDAECFLLAMENQDLSWMIKDPRIIIYLGTDKNSVTELFRNNIKAHELENLKVLIYSPVVRHFEENYTILQKHVNDAIANLMINLNTLSNFAADWSANFLRNLPQTLVSPGISGLKGAFTNKPAIIVSAGPSLRKNVHLLTEAKNRALIIAVGPVLRLLLEQGIAPDVVVSMDAGMPNWRHFEGVNSPNTFLVFDYVVNYNIVKNFAGPKFVCGSHSELIQSLEKFGVQNKGVYKAGPSVANMAFDLARQMEANPIILIGQDLAYTGGVSHAEGTAFSHQVDLKNRKFLVEVEDVFGNKVVTDRGMYTFLEWFNKEILLTKGVTVIDATEGGAKISGTVIMPLQRVIEEYCQEVYDFHGHLNQLYKNQKVPLEEVKQVYNKVTELSERLDIIKGAAKKGVELSDELARMYRKGKPRQDKLNKVLKKLNQVDKTIKSQKDSFHILELIFRPIFIQLQREMSRKNDQCSENEQGLNTAQNSKILYMGIKDVAEHMDTVVQETEEAFKLLSIQGW